MVRVAVACHKCRPENQNHSQQQGQPRRRDDTFSLHPVHHNSVLQDILCFLAQVVKPPPWVLWSKPRNMAVPPSLASARDRTTPLPRGHATRSGIGAENVNWCIRQG